MTDTEKTEAKNFQSKVETSTISVGAPPPASGSTLQWASTVKDNPVPTKYELVGIETLFSEQYMGGTGIDFKAMFKMINDSKTEYCEHLKKKGEVNSCDKLESYTKFNGIALGGTYYRSIRSDLRSCKTSCLEEDKRCIGLSHSGEDCHLYDSLKKHEGSGKDASVVILLIDRIDILDVNVEINHLRISATARTEEKKMNSTECKKSCKADPQCIAFTFKEGTGKDGDCKLYQKKIITEDSIKYDGTSHLEFVANKTLSLIN